MEAFGILGLSFLSVFLLKSIEDRNRYKIDEYERKRADWYNKNCKKGIHFLNEYDKCDICGKSLRNGKNE